MFDGLIKDIKDFNSKANWANLIAGVALMGLLVWGSLRLFGGNNTSSNGVPTDPDIDSLNTDTRDESSQEEDSTVSDKRDNDLGTGGPVDVLPNTSSK